MNKFGKQSRAEKARRLKKENDVRALYERYKNETFLPRTLFEKFREYIEFSNVTRRDIIDEEFDKVYTESNRVIKKCEADRMIFVGSLDNRMPLEIYWERPINFIELLEKGVGSEYEQYQLFKSWFFTYAVSTFWDSMTVVPSISTKTLNTIKNNAPSMWLKLQGEGKAYYEKAGYFEAKKKKEEALKKKKEQIRSLTDEELNKVVAIEKDGRRIWIFD